MRSHYQWFSTIGAQNNYPRGIFKTCIPLVLPQKSRLNTKFLTVTTTPSVPPEP